MKIFMNTDERTQSGGVFRAIAVPCLCRLEVKDVDVQGRTSEAFTTTSSGACGGRHTEWEGHGDTASSSRVSNNDDCQCQRLVHGQII